MGNSSSNKVTANKVTANKVTCPLDRLIQAEEQIPTLENRLKAVNKASFILDKTGKYNKLCDERVNAIEMREKALSDLYWTIIVPSCKTIGHDDCVEYADLFMRSYTGSLMGPYMGQGGVYKMIATMAYIFSVATVECGNRQFKGERNPIAERMRVCRDEFDRAKDEIDSARDKINVANDEIDSARNVLSEVPDELEAIG
jgi:hypothetical protein